MPVDHLTGLFSRESLKEFLQENMLEAASERKSLLITLVDLDHFKNFNDKFGHVFGDEILKYAAETLRSTMGETSNYFFRYGGDEFIVVSIDKKPADIIRALRKYNFETHYKPFLAQSRSYRIVMSAGIAIFPKDAQTVDELIRKADKAMYFSKRHGRKAITLVSRMKYVMMSDIFTLSALASAGLYLIMYLFYNPSVVSGIGSYFMNQAKRVKIVRRAVSAPGPAVPGPAASKPSAPNPSDLDAVTLKNGNVYEGRILVNNPDGIIISVKSEKGEYMFSFPAEKIDSIKYGSKDGRLQQ